MQTVDKISVGYGVTVWTKGEKNNHLDGIGVYTRELYHALMPLISKAEGELQPIVFGNNVTLQGLDLYCFKDRFAIHVLKSIFLRSKLRYSECNKLLSLFHATDHHIPALKNTLVVATVMDLIPFLHPEWVSGRHRLLKNWLFKQTILSAQHIITISEYSKQDLIQHFGLSPDSISVTYLGVNPVYFETVSENKKRTILKSYNLKPGFFLFVGTLQPRKNLERLLEAHKHLPMEYQKKHPLVIVGKLGWKVDNLLESLTQGEKEKTIVWLKYLPQDEVIVLLQCAKALMFISLYEGFGLPIIEAFAAGCPVIASNTTSIPEAAGDAAYLVNPLNINEIILAMVEIIKNPEVSVNLIEKGKMRAKLFTWEACAKQTLSIYKKVLTTQNFSD